MGYILEVRHYLVVQCQSGPPCSVDRPMQIRDLLAKFLVITVYCFVILLIVADVLTL